MQKAGSPWFYLVALFVVLSFSTSQTQAQGSSTDLAALFENMSGEWHCKGATAKGKETAATITIEPNYEGKVLVYRHKGLVGHTNESISIWSYDKPNENLVVARHFITKDGNFADVFAGETWTKDRLVLQAKTLWQPLWAENRFTYEIESDKKMRVVWEIKKDDWEMGDYLNCTN